MYKNDRKLLAPLIKLLSVNKITVQRTNAFSHTCEQQVYIETELANPIDSTPEANAARLIFLRLLTG